MKRDAFKRSQHGISGVTCQCRNCRCHGNEAHVNRRRARRHMKAQTRREWIES